MWTLFVVLRFPITYLPACVKEVGEPAHSQALFAQPTMEALHVRVLRRLAGLDVPQVDLPLTCPGQKVTTGQLRPVVTANGLRKSAHGDDFVQDSRHPPAGEACVHLQSQTLPRE